MKKILLPLIIILFGCSNDSKFLPDYSTNNNIKQKKIIYIQPLGKVKKTYLETVKNSIDTFYGFECHIKNEIPLTYDILAASGKRYEASKILNKFKSDDNILILTEKDIACVKDNIPEWGVLGLGYRPGKTCVVSTFRMKGKISEEKIKDRLKKVTLHEVGHNLGLNHCDYDIHCLMNDAKGTIKQVDKEKIWLCQSCKSILKI